MKIHSCHRIITSVLQMFSFGVSFSMSAFFTQAATNEVSQTVRWLATTYLAGPQQQPAAPITVVTNPVPASDPVAATNQMIQPFPSDWSGHLGLAVEYRRTVGGDYTSMSEARLSLELRKGEHHAINTFALGGVLKLEDDSRASAAAHTPLLLGWGFGYRYYFTRRHTFLRPYVTAEASFLWMYWEYKDDVVSDGSTYSSDSVEGLDGYVGAGLLVGSDKGLTFFGEIGAGGVSIFGTTHRDLKNELFDSFGYAGVKAGLSFRF